MRYPICLLFLSLILTWPVDTVAQWTQRSNFPGNPRGMAFSFSIGDKGYVGGGLDTNRQYADFWEYDPHSNAWKQKANAAGGARTAGVSFSIGSTGYVGLGTKGVNTVKDLWAYDPAANSWILKTALPGPARKFACAFSINNKGYVTCGIDAANGQLNDLWEYDPQADSWTRKADFPGSPRNQAVGFSANGTGYVGGGWDSAENVLDDFYAYDPTADTWTSKAALPGKRFAACAVGASGKAYVACGYVNGFGCHNDLWEYDPQADTWSSRPSLPAIGRYYGSAFTIADKLYLGPAMRYNPIPPSSFYYSFYNELYEYDLPASGIYEQDKKPDIALYPNPVSGQELCIRSAHLIKSASITNSMGQHVFSVQPWNLQAVIYLPTLAPGLYFVSCKTDFGKVVQKLVVR